jgi:hypothetical protein
MNILIENQEPLEYFSETGNWTKDPREGKCFASSRVAYREAKQKAIGKFNIVCHIPTTNQLLNMNQGRGTGGPET